jgi:hypothetical protein
VGELDRVARINRKLAGLRLYFAPVNAAAERDESGGVRGFTTNPPLTEAEVVTFERHYRITLPDAYRAYRLRIADGGVAGPYHGVLRLRDWQEFDEGWPAQPFPVGPGHEYADRGERGKDIGRSTDDDWYTYKGVLAISKLGRGCFAGLVVTGIARGRIVHTCNDERPPSFTPHADFLSWYEGWLDEVVCGRTHLRYGRVASDPEVLLPVLRSTDAPPEERADAALALAISGGVDGPAPEALPALREAATDDRSLVRGAALCSLGRRPPAEENTVILRAALEDPVPRISDIARWSLGRSADE